MQNGTESKGTEPWTREELQIIKDVGPEYLKRLSKTVSDFDCLPLEEQVWRWFQL